MSATPKSPLTALAEKIYVELVCRGVVITENAAQIKVNPENLAKISLKLAEAFERVANADKIAAAPKNQAFDMQATDLSAWNAPK